VLKSYDKHTTLSFECNDINSLLSIKSEGGKISIEISYQVDQWPVLDEMQSDYIQHVDSKTLLTALEKTAYSMAKQDVRYYLNGVLFDFNKDGLKIVSTDGHRMSWCDLDLKIQDDKKYIVSGKTIKTAIKMLKKSKGLISVQFCDNRIVIENHSTWILTAKLIDGQYPSYQSVIPSYNIEDTVIINRKAFLNACKSAKNVSNEKYIGVKMELSDNHIKVSSKTDHNEFRTTLTSDHGKTDLTVGFNVIYLIDAITKSKNETVSIELRDEFTSALIDGNNIVMPMRLS